MILIGILMGIMVVDIFYQVVLRYVFRNANTWSDELARYSMMWIVMLGSPVVFRRNQHIKVDLFIEKVPPKFRKIIKFTLYVVMIFYLAVLFKGGLTMTINASVQLSPGMELNMAVMYASILIGTVLMILYILENMFKELFAPAAENGRVEKKD